MNVKSIKAGNVIFSKTLQHIIYDLYIIRCDMIIHLQILVTKPDFYNENSRQNLRSTILDLLKLKIIPIINANDAVAPPPEADLDLTGVSHCSWGRHETLSKITGIHRKVLGFWQLPHKKWVKIFNVLNGFVAVTKWQNLPFNNIICMPTITAVLEVWVKYRGKLTCLSWI